MTRTSNVWNDEAFGQIEKRRKEVMPQTWHHVNRDEASRQAARQELDQLDDQFKQRQKHLIETRPFSIFSVHDCECEIDRADMRAKFEDAFEGIKTDKPIFVCSLSIWVVLAFEGNNEFLNDEHWGFDENPTDEILRITAQDGCGSFETFGQASNAVEAMELLDDEDFWQED